MPNRDVSCKCEKKEVVKVIDSSKMVKSKETR